MYYNMGFFELEDRRQQFPRCYEIIRQQPLEASSPLKKGDVESNLPFLLVQRRFGAGVPEDQTLIYQITAG